MLLLFLSLLTARTFLSAQENPEKAKPSKEYPFVRLSSSAGFFIQDQPEALFGQAQVRFIVDLSLPLGDNFYLDPFLAVSLYSDSAKLPVTTQYKAGSAAFSGGLGAHWADPKQDNLSPFFALRAFAEGAKVSLAPLYYFYPSLRLEAGLQRLLGESLFCLGLYGEAQFRKDPQTGFAFGLFASIY